MRVFVYGTLKAGHRNSGLLAAATFVGDAVTSEKFTMFAQRYNHYPMVADGGTTTIKGEVYEVNKFTLYRLDALEGHPLWYKRKEVNTSLGKAWMYLMPREKCEGLNEVQSGNWR